MEQLLKKQVNQEYLRQEEQSGGNRIVKSIVIPDTVVSISNNAFRSFYALESVTIPNSVTSIGNYAFLYCGGLNTVYYQGTEEEWKKISIDDWGNDALTNAQIIYNQ